MLLLSFGLLEKEGRTLLVESLSLMRQRPESFLILAPELLRASRSPSPTAARSSRCYSRLHLYVDAKFRCLLPAITLAGAPPPLLHAKTNAGHFFQPLLGHAPTTSSSSYLHAPPTSTRPSPSTGDKSSSKQVTPSSTRPLASNYKSKTSSSSAPPNDPGKASSLKCFTCGGRGHKFFQCINRCTMIASDTTHTTP